MNGQQHQPTPHDAAPNSAMPPARDEVPSAGHAPNTVHAAALIGAGTGLVLLVALALLLMYATRSWLARQQPEIRKSSLAGQSASEMPGPLVTADQQRQLLELRESEQRRLTRYEWIDEAAGVARIPITRAMEILAQDGLPEIPEGEATVAEENNKPGGQQAAK